MTKVPSAASAEAPSLSFDLWLKRRRKALGLTQAELARQVACATISLKKIEAGDLQPSQQLAELLAAALGLPPADQPAFVRFARTALSAVPAAFHLPPDALQLPPPRAERVRSNLPSPLTTLVGRAPDVAAGIKLLRRPDVRLLTLVGPPGAGKTRLSIEIAAAGRAAFIGGVSFVELAPASTRQAALDAIAASLGVSETPGLTLETGILNQLGEHPHLLVLDNFEQVMPAAPLVAELLSRAAGLKILVTSREALQVYGEHRFPVAALELPDVRHLPPLERLALYPAIELFVQRARAGRPDFNLTADNAATVATLCAWLDGLPLALEMAAARVRWLNPEDLLAQLSQRLVALAGGPRDRSPRQQTLRGAIDWSYALLDPDEQRVFAGCAIFVGGCPPEAARQVLECVPGPEALAPELESLVNKSLLRYDPAEDAPRLRMLETVREYAADKLAASPAAPQVRRRHAAYYLDLALTAGGPLLAQILDEATPFDVARECRPDNP